ncbi:hypothetical protein [Clostridium sp.]|uniref:hypothetical protein n=1 Tax=Clostridium sp. TaxID=1506 RepID=UPI002FCAC3F2
MIREKYRGIIEWIVAIVLIVVSLKFSILSYGSFSPVKAHEQSERTYHYGPSKIIKTIDLDGEKIYLCRYKDWFSANTVKKGVIKWYPGNQVAGYPIDYSKQVSFTWSGSTNKKGVSITKIYGYVEDSEITTILLVDENEENVFKYALDENRLFIFHWTQGEDNYKPIYLKGLNKNGETIYKEQAFYY